MLFPNDDGNTYGGVRYGCYPLFFAAVLTVDIEYSDSMNLPGIIDVFGFVFASLSRSSMECAVTMAWSAACKTTLCYIVSRQL